MKYMGDKNTAEMKDSLSFALDHITRHVAGITNKFIFVKKNSDETAYFRLTDVWGICGFEFNYFNIRNIKHFYRIFS
jgi:hypothetical protein